VDSHKRMQKRMRGHPACYPQHALHPLHRYSRRR